MGIKKATSSLLIFQNNKTLNRFKKVFNQLATGKRIYSASIDAATLNALNILDGALSSISNMMQRQRELAVQANNDTINPEQREILNREFQALAQEIDRVANTTNFNGKHPSSNGSGKTVGRN